MTVDWSAVLSQTATTGTISELTTERESTAVVCTQQWHRPEALRNYLECGITEDEEHLI